MPISYRIRAAERVVELLKQAEEHAMTDAYDSEGQCRLSAEYLAMLATGCRPVDVLQQELEGKLYSRVGRDEDWPRKVRSAMRELEGFR